MRSKLVRILFFIAFLIVNNVNAATLQNDSIFLLENGDSLHITYQLDTVRAVETEVSTSTFQPDPEKSVWLAAVVTGL